jgi:hypothetical protein
MVFEERGALPAVNEGIDKEDVRPPGEDVEPLPHHLDPEKKEGLGANETNQAEPAMERKTVRTI